MVVSQPGMMGHVVGSQARVEGVDERLGPNIVEAKEVSYNVKIINKIFSSCKHEIGLLS